MAGQALVMSSVRLPRPSPAGHQEPFAARLGLVLGAECLFAVLVFAATGIPPAFIVTVLFGLVLAVALEVQAAARRAPGA
jgi:Flp pilus assembly protein TadB